MSYLQNRRVYLGGPIEWDDPKVNWRDPVKAKLVKDFSLKVFDPAEDPKQGLRERIIHCKEKGLWDELTMVVHDFVRADLAVVDRADFIIQHLPYRVPTTGTHHEIINSNNAKKPTLLVCPQGKGRIPDWYFGFIDHHYMFGSWDELYGYLKSVDRGEHKDDDRWFFVYHYNHLTWVK